MPASSASAPIVVVGGGLAAGTVVTELREGGYDGPLAVYADEAHPPYERPPLSKDFMLDKGPLADALVHPEDWYAEHRVDLHTSTAGHRHRHRPPHDHRGRRRDAVLLPGAWPPARAPGTSRSPTTAAPRCTTSASGTTPSGCERPSPRARGWASSAAAGSASRSPAPPAQHGVEVVILEMAPQPLHAVLGDEVAALFADLHRAHGVDLRTGVTLGGIRGTANGAEVDADGDTVTVDRLLVGIGAVPDVRPRRERRDHRRERRPHRRPAADQRRRRLRGRRRRQRRPPRARPPAAGRALGHGHPARQGGGRQPAGQGDRARRAALLLHRPVRPRPGVRRQPRPRRLRPGRRARHDRRRRRRPVHRLVARGARRSWPACTSTTGTPSTRSAGWSGARSTPTAWPTSRSTWPTSDRITTKTRRVPDVDTRPGHR